MRLEIYTAWLVAVVHGPGGPWRIGEQYNIFAVAALASIVSMTEIDKGVATCLPRT